MHATILVVTICVGYFDFHVRNTERVDAGFRSILFMCDVQLFTTMPHWNERYTHTSLPELTSHIK